MEDARILIVEDEADLREGLTEYLTLHRFRAVGCADGVAATAALAEERPDLVLLDLNLPGESGLAIARRLGALPDPPAVIMVTALGTPLDRIVGLELGADDYMSKPFEMRELLARVRSVLRRRSRPVAAVAAPPPEPAAPPPLVLRFAGFSLDTEARRLTAPDGREVPLTAMEYDLLRVLAERPNRVLDRERLLELAHGKEIEAFDRSVDIRVARLRRKLGDDAEDPRIIRTVRGAGYMFVSDGGGGRGA